jgi:hypothetical protein
VCIRSYAYSIDPALTFSETFLFNLKSVLQNILLPIINY